VGNDTLELFCIVLSFIFLLLVYYPIFPFLVRSFFKTLRVALFNPILAF
jgi:hypothetical protein